MNVHAARCARTAAAGHLQSQRWELAGSRTFIAHERGEEEVSEADCSASGRAQAKDALIASASTGYRREACERCRRASATTSASPPSAAALEPVRRSCPAAQPPAWLGGRVHTDVVPSPARRHSRPTPQRRSASQKLTQAPPPLEVAQRPDTQSSFSAQAAP